MFPGGMDPKKMQSLMRQMGIKSQEISANRVIIETDSDKIIIENPSVTQITMQGQQSFQINGEIRKEQKISEEDIKLVAEQAGCKEEEAKEALAKCEGDMAEAIVLLSGDKE